MLDSKNGVSGMLAGLILILALHLLVKLGEFVFELFKKKNELTEKNIDNLISALSMNTESLHRLEERMRSVETQLTEASKLKIDIRMLFAAIKSVAGERWPDIRKSIAEDDFPSR